MMTNLSPLLSTPVKSSGVQPTSPGRSEDGSIFDEVLATAESEESTRILSEQEVIQSESSRDESRPDNEEDASSPLAQPDAATLPNMSSVHTYATPADSSKSPGIALSLDVPDASADATQPENIGAAIDSTHTAADPAMPTGYVHRTGAMGSTSLLPQTPPTIPGSTLEVAAHAPAATHTQPETTKNISALVGAVVPNSETTGGTLTAAAAETRADALASQPESLSRRDLQGHGQMSLRTSQFSARLLPGETDPALPTPTSSSASSPAPQPTAPIPPSTASVAHTPRSALVPQLAPALLTVAQAGEGTHQFTVTVSPENLGPVTVRAHISGGSLLIELFSPSDIGRDAVRHILSDLRRDLASVAPHASLNLSSGDAPTGQTGSQTFNGGSHNQQQSLDQRATPGAREESDDPPHESQKHGLDGDVERPRSPVPQHPLRRHNTIDVFA